MDLKEQEKFLEIKKEVIKVIESKQEKIKKNNIKIDIMVDIMNIIILDMIGMMRNIILFLK